MDQRLRLRAAHRRIARPAHASRPHPGDEWRQLSAPAEQTASAYCGHRDRGQPSRYMISGKRLWLAPAQAELRDITLRRGSHATHLDRSRLITAIRRTTMPPGHNKRPKYRKPLQGLPGSSPDAFLLRPADAFSLRR